MFSKFLHDIKHEKLLPDSVITSSVSFFLCVSVIKKIIASQKQQKAENIDLVPNSDDSLPLWEIQGCRSFEQPQDIPSQKQTELNELMHMCCSFLQPYRINNSLCENWCT